MIEASGRNPVREAWSELDRSFAQIEDVELTILMPCLDEAETLGSCIDKAQSFLARTGIAGEILIADNGSTDGSEAIARAAGARVVHVPSRGYGSALIAGIEAARGRFVIMGDSDDSYDFRELDGFVENLRAGYSLVMGNRFEGGIMKDAMPPLHRYVGNPILSFVGRLFFGSGIGDFHCGLRGFDREAVQQLKLDSAGMEFASEMVVKATLAGLKVTEVPTTLSPDGRSRPPYLRSWRDGWRHLKLLLMLAPDWLFLYPGAALGGSGVMLAAALLPGPLRINGLTLDSATLLFAVAAVIVGAQVLSFYVVAKAFAGAEYVPPPPPGRERLENRFTVDRLCLAGAGLFLLGAAIGGGAVMRWMEAGFGDLDPSVIIRFASLSTLGMALGIQSITTGFLLGLVQSRRRTMLAESSLKTPDQMPEKRRPESEGEQRSLTAA